MLGQLAPRCFLAMICLLVTVAQRDASHAEHVHRTLPLFPEHNKREERSHPGAAVVRTTKVPSQPVAVAVDARAGRVVVLAQGAGRASVSFLDARTGKLIRTTALGASVEVGAPPGVSQGASEPLAIDPKVGRVFVLDYGALTAPQEAGTAPIDGKIHLLDVVTGRVLKVVPVGPNPLTLIADTGSGHLFVPTTQAVRMLSAADGTLLRMIPAVPSARQDRPIVDARRGRIIIRGAARPDGPAEVIVIDAATGRVAHMVPLALSSTCDASIVYDEAANRFVAATGEARVSMSAQILDGNTGRVVHEVTLQSGGPVAGGCPIALAADASTSRALIYLPPPYTGGSSFVAVLDTRDGRVLQTVATGYGESTAVALAIDHRRERALIADTFATGPLVSVNRLTVLDLHSGRPRPVASPMLGQGPPAIAVDEQTGRAFVVNGADGTVSVLDVSRD